MLRSIVDGAIDPQCPFEMVSVSALREPGVRWTESQNPFSERLSAETLSDSLEIFFDSHRRGISVLSDPRTFAPLAKLIYSLEVRPPKRIIMGGAGSSGRVSVILSHLFEEELSGMDIQVIPWMVGGARAVKQTVENAEDNPHALMEFLEKSGHSPLNSEDLFIGISCGASAPSVAGALKFSRDHGARCALIANNPLSMAPAKNVEGLPGGMKQVLIDLSGSPLFFPLPALFGAEVLTGSTRLNGGTTSWLLLEAILKSCSCVKPPLVTISELKRKTESNLFNAWRSNYERMSTSIPFLVDALRDDNSSISLIGNSVTGRVCVLDASEHPPTFGVPVGRVAAFLPGGWNTILGKFFSQREIEALEIESPTGTNLEDFPKEQNGFLLKISSDSFQHSVFFPCDDPITTKMLLNTLTTISYAHAGFVDGNIMVNMIPSNIKLIERAVRIISRVVKVSHEEAERALCLAICGDIPDVIDFEQLAKESKRGVLEHAISIARERNSA